MRRVLNKENQKTKGNQVLGTQKKKFWLSFIVYSQMTPLEVLKEDFQMDSFKTVETSREF